MDTSWAAPHWTRTQAATPIDHTGLLTCCVPSGDHQHPLITFEQSWCILPCGKRLNWDNLHCGRPWVEPLTRWCKRLPQQQSTHEMKDIPWIQWGNESHLSQPVPVDITILTAQSESTLNRAYWRNLRYWWEAIFIGAPLQWYYNSDRWPRGGDWKASSFFLISYLLPLPDAENWSLLCSFFKRTVLATGEGSHLNSSFSMRVSCTPFLMFLKTNEDGSPCKSSHAM